MPPQKRPAAAVAEKPVLKIKPELADMSLDEKITHFRKEIVGQKKAVDAQVALREYFTESEMSYLWGKLKRRINSSEVSVKVKQEWDKICKKGAREGKNELKNKALATQLAFPKEWQDLWVHEVQKVITRDSKGENVEFYYLGELEQIHGVAEANAFIAKGKYIEEEDSDGDVVYRKARKFEHKSTTHENSAEMKGSTKIDEDKKEMVEESMNKWYQDMDYHIPGSSKGGQVSFDGKNKNMKRPAASGKSKAKALKNKSKKDDLVSEESVPPGPDPDKKEKTPEERARTEVRKSAAALNSVSSKLLTTYNEVKKGELSDALRGSLKTKQKEMEAFRGKLMAAGTAAKVCPNTIKKECKAAAALVSEASDLIKMAKPFKNRAK